MIKSINQFPNFIFWEHGFFDKINANFVNNLRTDDHIISFNNRPGGNGFIRPLGFNESIEPDIGINKTEFPIGFMCGHIYRLY